MEDDSDKIMIKDDPDLDTISIKDESDSSCSTVPLKRSYDSDFVCISSDDEEPSPKKRKRNTTASKSQVRKTKKPITSETNEDVQNVQPHLSSNKRRKKTSSSSNKLKKAKPKSNSRENDSKSSSNKVRIKKDTQISSEWMVEELLSEKEKLNKTVAHSLIRLFEDGNTIPFIARYRRHLTGDMTPEKIRYMKETYDDILELKTKANKILNTMEKSGKLEPEIKQSILCCKSLEELEHIHAPYKEASKKSLAERAKKLGLGEPAEKILNGVEVDTNSLVQLNGPEGLRTKEEVENNIINIISHIIAHNAEVLAFLRDLKELLHFKIITKISSSAKKNPKDENVGKFEQYFDKQFNSKFIQPHQILAINRGESLKVLSVQVIIPDFAFNKFKYFCEQKWLKNSSSYSTGFRLIQETLNKVYPKNISPLITRKVRSELKTIAHKEAVEVFAKNLKRLLLEPPVKGKVIMGIDPGLKLGCKVAVISTTGDVLDTAVIYPHTKFKNEDASTIRDLLQKHKCSLVAIGNGKACRETETWLVNLIKKDYFYPLNISYTIVDESGASVYSCSDIAKQEFPDFDPLLISAISLARRVQDPLAELVKIDPKNLGVGMYQHDVSQKQLDTTLKEVISECVSFIGVDVNTASCCLLRHVSGLTSQRAENIIQYRIKNGPFTNRQQLKKVKSIGEKTFEQCVGFLRIIPSKEEAAEFYDRPDTNPLDATDIHPETYEIVEKMLKKFGLSHKNIGQPEFIQQFKNTGASVPVNKLASDYKTKEQTIILIIDALSKPLAYDLRSENSHGPIFKREILTVEDLKPGSVVTGRVQNVVAFGAFIDIGVGNNGLIHNSKMNGQKILLGQTVQATVENIKNNRISLILNHILS